MVIVLRDSALAQVRHSYDVFWDHYRCGLAHTADDVPQTYLRDLYPVTQTTQYLRDKINSALFYAGQAERIAFLKTLTHAGRLSERIEADLSHTLLLKQHNIWLTNHYHTFGTSHTIRYATRGYYRLDRFIDQIDLIHSELDNGFINEERLPFMMDPANTDLFHRLGVFVNEHPNPNP